jgi:hypothetical protein
VCARRERSLFLSCLLLYLYSRRSASNFSAIEGERRVKLLQATFPKQTFSVYTYKFNWSDKNSVLLLYLYKKQTRALLSSARLDLGTVSKPPAEP